MSCKLLDVTKLHALGLQHKIEFEDGLKTVMTDFYHWQTLSERG